MESHTNEDEEMDYRRIEEDGKEKNRDNTDHQHKTKKRSFWKALFRLFGRIAAGVMKHPFQVIALLCILIVAMSMTRCFDIKLKFFQREKTHYSSDAIREELVKIGELATLQYNYTIVSDLVYTNKTAWVFSSEDRLIYSIDGIIKLGIDCSQLKIDCEDTVLTVYLPEVKILSHELDESSYHEYLVKGNISTSEFNETRIDDKLGQEEKVEENGLKQQAWENAKDTIGNILGAVMIQDGEEQTHYEIVFKSLEEYTE